MSEETIFGKHILVGIAYLDSAGEISKRIQLHGTIIRIAEHSLYFDRADEQGEFSIPFDGELEEGDHDAVYTLSSTGEKVTNVDYISSWTVSPPKEEE